MKKLAKYVVSWSVPAVVLFLVVMGNMSMAKEQDAGPRMCPTHRDAGCDAGGVDAETPDIPTADAGTPAPPIKLQFNGRELHFVPTAGKNVVDGGKIVEITDRRAEVFVVAANIAESMAETRKHEVRINNLFFAAQATPKADAAVVVFTEQRAKDDAVETALVFIYNEGKWHVMPTDFLELSELK